MTPKIHYFLFLFCPLDYFGHNRMNSSNSQLSSLWSLVPFTKANREARYVLNKQRLKQEYEEEHQRIKQLEQFLIECDRKQIYDPILKQLLLDSLLDTTHSPSSDDSRKIDSTEYHPDILPALIHFQRLKYLDEQTQQLQLQENDKIHTFRTPEQASNLQRPEPDSHICTWVGISEKGEPLHCVNKAIFHPWKQYRSHSTGTFSSVPTGFCIFHQKYCLDTKKRHHTKDEDAHTQHSILRPRNSEYQLCPISLPNRLGLCKECFVLENGHPPPRMSDCKQKTSFIFCHVPGVMRRKMMKSEES